MFCRISRRLGSKRNMTATRDTKHMVVVQGIQISIEKSLWTTMRYFSSCEDEYCQDRVEHCGCRVFAFLTTVTTRDTRHKIVVKRYHQIRGVDCRVRVYHEIFSPF